MQYRPGMVKDASLALAGKTTTHNTAKETQKCIALEVGNSRSWFMYKDGICKVKILLKVVTTSWVKYDPQIVNSPIKSECLLFRKE